MENLSPPQQVELLISTLERGGNIVPLARALENRFKTFKEFGNTNDRQAFGNEKLVDLTLKGLSTADEFSLPSFLSIVRRLAWIGNGS
jgi:hypothetical protein